MTERFNQNAATAAALHDRIQQAENNLITHCDIDALDDGFLVATVNKTNLK